MFLYLNWRNARAWISFVGGIAAIAATSYLLWVQLHPDDGNGAWEVAAILVAGFVAVCSALARPLRIYTKDKYDGVRSKVSVSIRALPWTLNGIDADIPVRPLGVSAYVVVGVPGFRWLHRLAHERVNEKPLEAVGMRWTKGKGIIGQCWRDGEPMCVDSADFDATHERLTQAEWEVLPEDERRRLTPSEYRKMRGKYGTVVAVPMLYEGRVIGVVALDAPGGLHTKIEADAVQDAVADSAAVVRNLLT